MFEKSKSLEFLAQVQKGFVVADLKYFKSHENPKDCYKILREYGLNIQCLKMGRYCKNTPKRIPFAKTRIYFIPGQESGVYKYIIDKFGVIKASHFDKFLGLTKDNIKDIFPVRRVKEKMRSWTKRNWGNRCYKLKKYQKGCGICEAWKAYDTLFQFS